MRGAGTSDAAGLGVDNIRLVKDGSTQNLVVNGDFENPKVPKDWQGFNGGIQGWACDYMEIGVGTFFNKRWPSQVCELDVYHNTIITQKISLNESGKDKSCLTVP